MASQSPDQLTAPADEQRWALRNLLLLSVLLTQQDSQDDIVHLVANAVGSLGQFTPPRESSWTASGGISGWRAGRTG